MTNMKWQSTADMQLTCRCEWRRAAKSGKDWQRLAKSGEERQRVAKSGEEQQRAAKSGKEQQRAAKSGKERGRAGKSSEEFKNPILYYIIHFWCLNYPQIKFRV